MSRTRSPRSAGFSFVEVLFAVFLTGCCAAIVSAAMPTATLSRTKSDNANRAAALAQRELESVRGLGYGNLSAAQLFAKGLLDSETADANGNFVWTSVDSAAGDSVANNLPNGTGTLTIQTEDIELRRVTVRVNWNDRGTNRSFTLSTLVANL